MPVRTCFTKWTKMRNVFFSVNPRETEHRPKLQQRQSFGLFRTSLLPPPPQIFKKRKKERDILECGFRWKKQFLVFGFFFWGGRFIFRWEKMKESPTHWRVSRPLETPRPIPPRTECVCVRVRVWVHALERERVIVREKGWGFYANESWANRNEPSSDQIPSCPWLQ